MTGHGLGSVPLSAAAHRPLAPAGQAPVIVLTMARSGSTLLRFILDSHPELACPPETCLGSACFMLARMWDLLDPSPQSAEEGFLPGRFPAGLTDTAIASIRAAVDDVYGRYLVSHGKRRWCDKSLDNIGLAELLATIYPDAQFICLYRHCFDVIASVLEACPWGLSGYGLEQYASGSSTNSVAPVAVAWLDRTADIIKFQEQHPDRCHGIRYEDLVTTPEEVAASLFDFLEVQRVPGITSDCFAAEHEMRGPGDHKIWFTGRISRDSIGQGVRVPSGRLPSELLGQVNEVLDQLEYRQVDDKWRSAIGPLDPRVGHELDTGQQDAAGPAAEAAEAAAVLSARLAAAAAAPGALAASWPESASRQIALVIGPVQGSGPALGWTISYDDSGLAVRVGAAPDQAGAAIEATGVTWLSILNGRANMAGELRAGRLRVTIPADRPRREPPGGVLPEAHLLAYLLGLSTQPPARSRVQQPDMVTAAQ
jgi:protein-tyrosine sulfotransferase